MNERFCSNPACKFHNYYVAVGVKFISYIDPIQFGETPTMEYSGATPKNETLNVMTIKRDWIYRDGQSLDQFCTVCARKLLGLPKVPTKEKEIEQ